MLTSGYETAIERCYEAVADPERWNSALDRLAGSLGSTGAMFYPKDVNENANQVPSSSVYSELLEDYVAGNWFENHYRAVRGWTMLANGRPVIVEHDLATDEERRKLAHYNELYLRWGFPGFAAIGFNVDGQEWCLPLLRGHKEGFFTHEEADRFADLAPHLSRMMRLAGLFEKSRNEVSLDAFDRTGTAAGLVDVHGRVVALNARAEAVIGKNLEFLSVSRGHLRAASARCNSDLQRLIRAAVAKNLSPANTICALPVYVQRLGRGPIVVEAMRPPGVVRQVSSSATAILLFKDTEDGRKVDPKNLSQAFDLTPAESALCVELAEGSSLSEAAGRLGIREGTARQRLKDVFQKTGTHRQSELMLLILRV